MTTIKKFSDSQQQEAWRAYACAALASMTVAPDYSKGSCNGAMTDRAVIIADRMMAEEMKRSRG